MSHKVSGVIKAVRWLLFTNPMLSERPFPFLLLEPVPNRSPPHFAPVRATFLQRENKKNVSLGKKNFLLGIQGCAGNKITSVMKRG